MSGQSQASAAAPQASPAVISFQGVPGAYSHLACLQVCPDMEPLPCPTFEAALETVRAGEAGLCMLPIENSLGGRVADTHHLLPDSGLHITREYFHPVHHHLMAPKGAVLAGLREVHSHEQALAQCRTTLRELGLRPVKAADTAGAARQIAELGDPAVGAIASSLAAERWGLEILRSRVEDKLGNVTRFVVMGRDRADPPVDRNIPCLTSLLFALRSIPAALYKAMGGFATNGVNFVKLESYIPVDDSRSARFYAEIEGHPGERPVDRALEELQYFTTSVRILGVYPQSPFRRQG